MQVEKLVEPIKFEIVVIPQPGKDAIISMQIFANEKQKPIGLEMTFFVFFQIFKTFVVKIGGKTEEKDLSEFLGKLIKFIEEEEPKVKTFKELKKLFIA